MEEGKRNRESLQDSAIHGGAYSTHEVCNFGYCAICLDLITITVMYNVASGGGGGGVGGMVVSISGLKMHNRR